MVNELKARIQLEALEAIGDRFRSGVAISMGVGKTYIALQHMVKNYTECSRFLVVSPKVDIYQSYRDDMNKFKLNFLEDNIEFTTYLSLPKKDLDYDVVYLDECHSLLSHHGTWLKKFKGKILGMTGTPPRFKNSVKGILVDTYCPIIYEYFVNDAVNDKVLNDYRIFIHSLDLDTERNIQIATRNKNFLTSEYNSYRYWSNVIDTSTNGKSLQIARIMRMKTLMGYDSKVKLARRLLNQCKDKTLVFANTKDQADILCVNSYYSGHPDGDANLKDFKSGKITKLSCVAKLNEGINIPGLKIGIILHAYGNEKKASQRIGRMLRLNPDDCSTIHVLCYKNTVDEEWVKSALKDFDQTKITWL